VSISKSRKSRAVSATRTRSDLGKSIVAASTDRSGHAGRHPLRMNATKLPCRQFLHLAGLAAAIAVLTVILSGHGAWSQTTRPIKIVVLVSPGGSMDILARLLGEQIGQAQRQTVLIENRPGAGGVVAHEAVSRAAPDGNTLLMIAADSLVTPHLRKLNYDILTSFEPICDLVRVPNLIVVNSASPYRTLADLLNAAHAKRGDLTLAGVGPATVVQIAFETLKRAAKVDMTFVPYPGGAPAVNALLGEHVSSVLTFYPTVAEQLKAGKLRALATGSRTRIESLPEVPTVAESGYADYEVDEWNGVAAPAKTPKETVSKLAGWFTAALQAPETKRKLVAQGLFPVGICGADFAALLRKQYDDFGRVIREANIKAE
jgi:tripartite-type tricarboxylate transporter receptor subunit TctC